MHQSRWVLTAYSFNNIVTYLTNPANNWSLISLTDDKHLILTVLISNEQFVEKSVTVNNNPIQNNKSPENHNYSAYFKDVSSNLIKLF